MSLRLRERLLTLLAGDEKPAATTPVPVISVQKSAPPKFDVTPAPASSDGEACPKCGGRLFEVAAGILRCPQDGYQRGFEKKCTMVGSPIIAKSRAAAPNACPKCGSALMTPVGAAFRCGQCGHQVEEPHATGLSRAELETYDGPPAHARMNGASFYQACARMRGFAR